jgi:hypothetical protein
VTGWKVALQTTLGLLHGDGPTAGTTAGTGAGDVNICMTLPSTRERASTGPIESVLRSYHHRPSFGLGLAEVAHDPVVRAFAWAVLAGHGVVLAFLIDSRALSGALASVEPWCWPYFEACWQFRLPSHGWITLIHVVLLVLIAGAAWSLLERRVRTFWLLLAGLNACLFLVMSADYRLRLNELYMLFWLNAVFLFWPAKRWAIPLTLFSFYFWAGRLKLNNEWLSGAVLYDELWLIPKDLEPAACAYVVVLEIMISWGLLSSRPTIVCIALVQFAMFHVQSLSQIHWFYPALMGTMLSWFVLEMKFGHPKGRATLGPLLRGQAPHAAYALVAAFAFCQLLPLLYRGDSALTGQGRAFALHMFQARQVCEVTATIHRNEGTFEVRDLKLPNLAPRSVCDPVIYYSRMQNLCRSGETGGGVAHVDFAMNIRRTTDSEFRTVANAKDFCGTVHDYSMLSNNHWLR